MSTYYIRKSGSDSHGGTSTSDAWASFGKALGASGIASGDIVYVGAGVYRETVSVAMTSAVAETKIIGDVDGVHTGDVGEVQLTGYTTNDTTAPSASNLIDLNGKSFLTFQNILFIGGSAIVILGTTATSTDIKFYKCSFITLNTSAISHTTAANVAANWTIDSCIFLKTASNSILFTLTRPTTADFDYVILIKNSLFIGGVGISINLTATGANTFKGGGVLVYNSTQIGTGALLNISSSNVSSTVQNKVYNCFVYSGGTGLAAQSPAGQLIEDYNVLICGGTPRTNVNAGAHSISDGSYAPLFLSGHEYANVGANCMPFGMPKPGSPLLLYGNQSGWPSVDILAVTRPPTPGIGCYELGNGGVRETSTTRTGGNALKIAGPGYHDFQVPVPASSTTMTIYAQYDSNYAGTKPSMNIVNGTECGVSNATATQAGSANTWEQLSLAFTPSVAGIITVRLISSSSASNGNAFFDDFDIT